MVYSLFKTKIINMLSFTNTSTYGLEATLIWSTVNQINFAARKFCIFAIFMNRTSMFLLFLPFKSFKRAVKQARDVWTRSFHGNYVSPYVHC